MLDDGGKSSVGLFGVQRPSRQILVVRLKTIQLCPLHSGAIEVVGVHRRDALFLAPVCDEEPAFGFHLLPERRCRTIRERQRLGVSWCIHTRYWRAITSAFC